MKSNLQFIACFSFATVVLAAMVVGLGLALENSFPVVKDCTKAAQSTCLIK